ncbi:uncharacterized protein LOC133185764 [Saccostrea echinata]|uniref:uncharacterized protein LOC133185764 n=1 Tax=Saccostrea echinata TaxID=191078 RepID=UPI002A80A24A|nr:uncharacterized protein LOC133185764 [Saccostrea echinata]
MNWKKWSIKSKPLHKKKKRLAKQNSKKELSHQSSVEDLPHPSPDMEENVLKCFRIFNRERELLLPTKEEEKTHRNKVNECYESQDELEASDKDSKQKITKQVTFDSSELTSKKPIANIGVSTSFS